MSNCEDNRSTVVAFTDRQTDYYCEPCRNDGIQIEAVGFCVNCSEYHCSPCYRNHTRYKASKDHVIQVKEKPTNIKSEKASITEDCREQCPIHEYLIESFCKSCDRLGCMDCMSTEHPYCSNVDYISNIVEKADLEISQQFEEFKINVDTNLETVDEIKKKVDLNVNKLGHMKFKAKEELIKLQEEIMNFFQNLKEEMENRIEEIDQSNQETLKTAAAKCDSIHDHLNEIKINSVAKLKEEQKSAQFIAIKTYKPKLLNLNEKIKVLKEESKLQRYALTPSIEIKEVLKNTSEICKLRTAKFVSEINVATDSDKETGSMCTIIAVHDQYLAVLDSSNKSVKMVDTQKMTVVHEMIMKCDYVYSVTNVDNDRIAVLVTSDMEQKIQLLDIATSGSLTTGSVINIDDNCGDLVYKQGNFYAVCYDGLIVMDMQGKTIKTIKTNNVRCIALSADNETIYMTNPIDNTVTSTSLDGKVKAIYKDLDLKRPKGLAIDSEGCVYVSCHGTHNIHQLSADCSKIQVFLDEVYGPTIEYCNADNRLYVGLGTKIKVYQT